MKDKNYPDWGLLPSNVKALVKRREWDNVSRLKSLLSGQKAFPIRISLKPPNARDAISNIGHYQTFIREWRSFQRQELLNWHPQNFRELPNQDMPIQIEMKNFQDLIWLLGDDAAEQSALWEIKMKPLIELNETFFPVLVKHLNLLEKTPLESLKKIATLLPQLNAGMGTGQYLRSLPFTGIDTKFIEKNQFLLEALADVIHEGEVSASGGLISWLGCDTPSKGWLTIKPLCESSVSKLTGLPLLQLPNDFLRTYELPAPNILIVENLQSGLALPTVQDTIAIIGGGNNIAWMDAPWLQQKRVGYWGDIDTWGLSILSEAREKSSKLESLMMDYETFETHKDKLGIEPSPIETLPKALTQEEAALLNALRFDPLNSLRLEQERISSQYIQSKLQTWLFSSKSN